MGSRGRPLFDLNEPPAEEDETDGVCCLQLQRAVPSSSTRTSDLFGTSICPQRVVNNNDFSHASSVSRFQSFIRSKCVQGFVANLGQTRALDMSKVESSSNPNNGENSKVLAQMRLGSTDTQDFEKEEGEWSDAEGSGDANKSRSMHEPSTGNDRDFQDKGVVEMHHSNCDVTLEKMNSEDIKEENNNIASSRVDTDANNRKSGSRRQSEASGKGDIMDGQEDSGLLPKQRETKGFGTNHALKCASNLGKQPKLDQRKETMLGKKRSRQTMFLNLEDIKQAGPIKTSTPRRPNFPAPVTTRTVKEAHPAIFPPESMDEKQIQKDTKQDF